MTNKLSDKDKKDWEKFVKGNEKVENKDKEYLKKDKKYLDKTIDLHGYTLEEANKKIATWSKYFPNQKDAFFYGFNDGQSYTIACWINETTKVRVQQQ